MDIIQLVDEDFVNYKKPGMVLAFPHCSFKCDRECGTKICQNSRLAKQQIITVSNTRVIDRYIDNSISKSIICQGLEPFDSWDELYNFIVEFREISDDDIVIYTGYTEDECTVWTNTLKQFSNIIIKYGRFIPDQEKHYDDVLGVYLASDNQYAKKIS